MNKLIFLFLLLTSISQHAYSMIYCAGSKGASMEIQKATVWITNDSGKLFKTVDLSEPGIRSEAVDCLTAVSSLYTVGRATVESIQKATLWKANVLGEFKKTVYLDDNSVAVGLLHQHDHLYIIGQKTGKAVLWITDENGDNAISFYLTVDPLSMALSLTLVDNKLYIAGIENSDQLTFWIFDLQDNTSEEMILANASLQDFDSFYTNHIGNHVYIVGNELEAKTTYATLWIFNTIDQSFVKKRIGDANSKANSFVNKGNKLYISGLQKGNKGIESVVSLLWTTTLQGDIIDQKQLSNEVLVFSIASLGDRLVFGGIFPQIKAALLISDFLGNVKLQEGLENNDEFSVIYNVYINVYIPETRKNAFREFSPLKFQKGF